jgi:hypothetical protein
MVVDGRWWVDGVTYALAPHQSGPSSGTTASAMKSSAIEAFSAHTCTHSVHTALRLVGATRLQHHSTLEQHADSTTPL